MTILLDLNSTATTAAIHQVVAIDVQDGAILVRLPATGDPPRIPAIDAGANPNDFDNQEPTWEDAEWQ